MTANLPPEAVEAAARAIWPLGWADAEDNDDTDARSGRLAIARVALSAALPLLTVKPDQDTIARALYQHHQAEFVLHRGPWDLMTDQQRRPWRDRADAVLAVLPGRTEAQVGAQYLRDAATAMQTKTLFVNGPPTRTGRDFYAEWLHARANRIERGVS